MSTSLTNAISKCSNCGNLLSAEAKFCSACGKALTFVPVSKVTSKQYLTVLGLSLVVFGLCYTLQPWFQGRRPVQTFEQKTASPHTDNAPVSNEELFAKAESTMQKIAESPNPEPAVMLEAVDLLSRILAGEPENPWALLQMAELSFEQKIFDKSAQFYERYLKLESDDQAVRTRFASALTFAGKSNQALAELDKVMTKDPNNFQALAFASIANQQVGNFEKSQEQLAKAITLAPNEEAKSRLLKFAQSLQEKGNLEAVPAANQNTSPKDLSPSRGNTNTAFSGLDAFFKAHPIAGPKYIGLQVVNNEIRVSMDKFPMDKMPPMVKDKFSTNAANEAKKESNGQTYFLVFIDGDSGNEMHRVEVK